MTSLSVILAVLTSNINHRGQKEIQVPKCVVSLLCFLGKVMCMEVFFIRPKKQCANYKIQSPGYGETRSHARGYNIISSGLSADSGCLMDYENGHTLAQSRKPCSNQNHVTRQPHQSSDETCNELALILEKLDELIEREGERENGDHLIKQWMEVAEIIDRFFFWLFVLGTTFVTLFLLVFYPMFKTTETIGEHTWTLRHVNPNKKKMHSYLHPKTSFHNNESCPNIHCNHVCVARSLNIHWPIRCTCILIAVMYGHTQTWRIGAGWVILFAEDQTCVIWLVAVIL